MGEKEEFHRNFVSNSDEYSYPVLHQIIHKRNNGYHSTKRVEAMKNFKDDEELDLATVIDEIVSLSKAPLEDLIHSFFKEMCELLNYINDEMEETHQQHMDKFAEIDDKIKEKSFHEWESFHMPENVITIPDNPDGCLNVQSVQVEKSYPIAKKESSFVFEKILSSCKLRREISGEDSYYVFKPRAGEMPEEIRFKKSSSSEENESCERIKPNEVVTKRYNRKKFKDLNKKNCPCLQPLRNGSKVNCGCKNKEPQMKYSNKIKSCCTTNEEKYNKIENLLKPKVSKKYKCPKCLKSTNCKCKDVCYCQQNPLDEPKKYSKIIKNEKPSKSLTLPDKKENIYKKSRETHNDMKTSKVVRNSHHGKEVLPNCDYEAAMQLKILSNLKSLRPQTVVQSKKPSSSERILNSRISGGVTNSDYEKQKYQRPKLKTPSVCSICGKEGKCKCTKKSVHEDSKRRANLKEFNNKVHINNGNISKVQSNSEDAIRPLRTNRRNIRIGYHDNGESITPPFKNKNRKCVRFASSSETILNKTKPVAL